MSHMYGEDPVDTTERRSNVSRYARNLQGTSLLVGGVVGLILGLVIGWVIWPVQWTNAWPADLAPEAKAQYLAAVAQVYAYYPDERAAETARMQLYDLNENLADEIAAAQAYFDQNPQRDSRVYITMLGQLAQGLGLQSDEIVTTAGDAGPATEPVAAEDSRGGASWVRWLFSLLLVVLLIGGGIYIISRLAKRRQGVLEGHEEEGPMAQGASYSDRGPVPSRASATPAGRSSPSTKSGYEVAGADDYQFDQEDDGASYSGHATVVRGAYVEEFEEEEFFDDESASVLPHTDSSRSSESVEAKAEAVAPTRSAQQTSAPVKAVRVDASRVLNTYVLHYQAGIVDYEQSHNIIDPANSRYIGECGMGVNVKNGILQDVPENVIALDVWLFDQKRDKSLGNQTRVLLSEYAIDHDLEQAFIREKPDAPRPVVAQPGVSFQLRGQSLVLDCEVLEAEYAKSGGEAGVFKNVKVEMTVRVRE